MSSTSKQVIPWEKWNLLSTQDISVLKSIGYELGPENPEVKTKKKQQLSTDIQNATAPPVHVTEVVVTCAFCRKRFSVYFDMVKSGNSLRGKRISEAHFAHLVYEKKKIAERIPEKAITCEHCESHLLAMTKEQLTDIILKQQIKIRTGR